MSTDVRIRLFVGGIAAASVAVGATLREIGLDFPGWWPIATFVFVASLLEGLHTQARLSAKGSLSFIRRHVCFLPPFLWLVGSDSSWLFRPF